MTLPTRWIKGLTSVQLYLEGMEEKFTLNKIQTVQLMQSIPKVNVKGKFFFNQRGNRLAFFPIASQGAVRIDRIQRLRLLDGILPYAEKVMVFQEYQGESCAFVLDFGKMRITLALSPDNYRGFSGKGNVLENMIHKVPDQWMYAVNSLLKLNELFNPTLLEIEHDVNLSALDTLTASISTMGLLCYDLLHQQHYYRRLPFKEERILSLNPRLKNAQKLVDNQSVRFIMRSDDYIEARVEGTGVQHTVIINDEKQQCTCNWYTNHKDKRGLCKQILVAKIKIQRRINEYKYII